MRITIINVKLVNFKSKRFFNVQTPNIQHQSENSVKIADGLEIFLVIEG